MNAIDNVLAKKYAQAFLNLYLDSISFEDYTTLKSAAVYLKKNRKFFSLLNIPLVPGPQKREILFSILDHLNVPKIMTRLIELIIKQQRIFLIPDLFYALTRIYEERKKINSFVITSSYELTAEQLEALKKFLETKTGEHSIYTYLKDKKLIAGIRMQSNTSLWHYSVAQHLADLRKTMK